MDLRRRAAQALVAVLAASCMAQDNIVVNVRDLGAKGDGQADDTQAFLRAVERAAATQTHVFVPKGTYTTSAPIMLTNVTVRGPEGAAWPADVDAMPTVLPLHRDGPCFQLNAAGALRGLNIDYRWDKEPDAGPAAILVSGIGVYISNLRVRYPWDGILCDGKTNVGRLNIENVFMVSPRNVGVRVTGTWDVPRLSNVEVWNAGPVKRGLSEGTGFHLGKNDLIRMTDCFAFAMHTGFLFEDEIDACEIKGATWGVMNGCATDFCGRSILVRGAHTVSVSGGSFWTHQESLLIEGEGGRIRVAGSELKSNGAPAVVVHGGAHTVITGCSILRPMESYNAPAVRLTGGNTILGSNHVDCFGDGIVIEPGTAGAVVTGNRFEVHGNTSVVDRSEGKTKVVVANNL